MISDIFSIFVEIEMLLFEILQKCFVLWKLSIPLLCILCFICVGLLFANFLLAKFIIQFVPSGQKGKLHIAFFHPYCNAGGGGERVLWTAIRSIQNRYPSSECYIYTGDCDALPEKILDNVKQRFNINLPRQPQFVYLKTRGFVEAKYYPIFTLLLQSLGGLLLGIEALMRFKPDIFIDTMGYAFTYPLFRFLGGSYVASYTHYPTISSEMVGRVGDRVESHNNRSFIADSLIFSTVKIIYYQLFACIYGLAGRCSNVVMVNSSWTKGHIVDLWGCPNRVRVVYPPCDTIKFSSLTRMPDDSKKLKNIVTIGQFRPEKDYPLQLRAFKRLLSLLEPPLVDNVRLVLIGGVRDSNDGLRVIHLQNLAQELEISDKVEWKINAPFTVLLDEVQKGTIGLHTMWNEHFGIGVVECMAGGLIMVANDSGGPKFDILQPQNGEKSGFLAKSEDDYAKTFRDILLLSSEEKDTIRDNAHFSIERFSELAFEESFLNEMNSILDPSRIE